MSSFKRVKELKTKFDKIVKKEGEKALEEIFKEAINKHNDLQEICIRGYTPSFNDGDPCIYGMGIESCRISNLSVTPEEAETLCGGMGDDDNPSGLKDCVIVGMDELGLLSDKKFDKIFTDFSKKLYVLEDVVQAVYGECEIRITKKNITSTEFYDHD